MNLDRLAMMVFILLVVLALLTAYWLGQRTSGRFELVSLNGTAEQAKALLDTTNGAVYRYDMGPDNGPGHPSLLWTPLILPAR